MTRLLPYPLLAAALTLMWLLLTGFSPGNLILGALAAVVAGQAMSALDPARPRLGRPRAILRLLGIVLADILRSNIAVARLILAGGGGRRRSGFVEIPLQLRDPTGLAILAVILTSMPGTAWIDYDATHRQLLLHVFDLKDADDWREIVTARYERLLLEILR